MNGVDISVIKDVKPSDIMCLRVDTNKYSAKEMSDIVCHVSQEIHDKVSLVAIPVGVTLDRVTYDELLERIVESIKGE